MANNGKSRNEALSGDMSRVKKILIFVCAGLTALLGRSIIANVKSIDDNSIKANLPDNAGELRGCEARTASMERHTSPALSGFFVRSAQKGRCVVESVETENSVGGVTVMEQPGKELDRDDRRAMNLVTKLEYEGKAFIVSQLKYRTVCLASIDMMLSAGDVFWGEDFYQALKEEKGMLRRDLDQDETRDEVERDNRHTRAKMNLSDVVSVGGMALKEPPDKEKGKGQIIFT
jgi:hypothetical protein